MRILLLGEYSGYYTNLAIGFQKLGHDVTLFSNGHGWMQLQGGTPYPRYQGITGSIKRKLLWKSNLKKFAGYDLVFLISPEFVSESWEPWYWDRIRAQNNLVIYTVCGQKDSNVLRRMPFFRKNIFLTDSGSIDIESTANISWHEYPFGDRIVTESDGVIAIAPDYYMAYESLEKPKACIPLPIDCSSVSPVPLPGGKLTFLHGKQHRPFTKGSSEIIEAFKHLNQTENVQFTHIGGLSLKAYQKTILEHHVNVDQCKTFSYGMNALYAMALGRIVMSSNEPEFSQCMKLPSPPVFNITFNRDQIESVAKNLLQLSPNELQIKADEMRQYAVDHHDAKLVAERYLQFAQGLNGT